MIRYTTRRITAKTAAYTIKKDQPDISGSLFTTRGAGGSVTITLPAPSAPIAGVWYEFEVLADQSLIVAAAAAGQIVTNGDLAADNVGFQVASQKIGGRILAICDGTSWLCIGFRPGGGFCVDGTEQSPTTGATLAQLAFLAVTAGTAAASKAVVLDANKSITGLGAVLGTDPARGIGYDTGAGGTVAQATNKSTGVALAKMSGAITMDAASLAAAAIVSFVLTNAAIAATDVLILNHISGGTVGAYTLNAQCAAGSATINVRNNTAGALAEALVIQFAVIKAVNA